MPNHKVLDMVKTFWTLKWPQEPFALSKIVQSKTILDKGKIYRARVKKLHLMTAMNSSHLDSKNKIGKLKTMKKNNCQMPNPKMLVMVKTFWTFKWLQEPFALSKIVQSKTILDKRKIYWAWVNKLHTARIWIWMTKRWGTSSDS